MLPENIYIEKKNVQTAWTNFSIYWVPTVSQILYKTCTYITLHQAKQAPKEETVCCWVIHGIFAGLVAQRGFHSWKGSDLNWLRHTESRARKPAGTLLLTWKVFELDGDIGSEQKRKKRMKSLEWILQTW